MSTQTPFSVLDSVDAAIGLVATRDLNPELDKDVYGTSGLNPVNPTQSITSQTKESENSSNTNTSQSITSQNITSQSITSQTKESQNNASQLIKVNEGKMESDPIILNNSNGTKSLVDSSVIVGSEHRPDLYLTPTIYPPNNGNRVTSIDQLVDPLKLRNILSMFSSVPVIKEQINPAKFDSINSRHSPSSTNTPSPPQLSPQQDQPPQLSPQQPQSSPQLLQPSPQLLQPSPQLLQPSPQLLQPSSQLLQPSTQPSPQLLQPSQPPQLNTFPQLIIEPEVRGPAITIVEHEILDTVNIVEERNEINQGWSVLDVVTKAIPPGWTNIFKASIPEFEHINKSLIQDEQQHGRFYPLRKDLFKAFDMCPLSNVKVVIVGQDPYHSDDHNGYPIAMGMSFSINRGVIVPSSLKNIYKELLRSIPNWNSPTHGDLSNWAKQGVLMLNTCLTVRPHQPKSHKSLWMGFVAKVIASLNEKNPRCIFVLWGREAEKIGNLLTNKNVVLTAPHPSGFSAYKGFIGCNHFADINTELEKQGKKVIDWTV